MEIVEVLEKLVENADILTEKKSGRYPSGRGKYKTKGSRRLYVISKRTHGGTDSESVVSGRIAKGFTPGSATPSSEWGSVKDHAARVGQKYRGQDAKKLSAKSRRDAKKGKKYKRKTKG